MNMHPHDRCMRANQPYTRARNMIPRQPRLFQFLPPEGGQLVDNASGQGAAAGARRPSLCPRCASAALLASSRPLAGPVPGSKRAQAARRAPCALAIAGRVVSQGPQGPKHITQLPRLRGNRQIVKAAGRNIHVTCAFTMFKRRIAGVGMRGVIPAWISGEGVGLR